MRQFHTLLTILFTSSLLLLSCRDQDDPDTITKDYYFQADIDGETVTFQEGRFDYINTVHDLYPGQASTDYVYVPLTRFAKVAAVDNPTAANLANSGSVGFIGLAPAQLTSVEAYAQLVTTGQTGMGFIPEDSTATGFAGGFVSFHDANGVEWNSSNGAAAVGSVVVTEYTTFVDNNRFPATQRIVAATFNCTLFNSQGESKDLTNGKVRGRLIGW
jgi:hypothetical protein